MFAKRIVRQLIELNNVAHAAHAITLLEVYN